MAPVLARMPANMARKQSCVGMDAVFISDFENCISGFLWIHAKCLDGIKHGQDIVQ